jgi:hypothetical protein
LTAGGAILHIVSGSPDELIAFYLRRADLTGSFRGIHGCVPSGTHERERRIADLSRAHGGCAVGRWLVTDNGGDLRVRESGMSLIQPLWFGARPWSEAGSVACAEPEELVSLISSTA